MKNSKNIQWKKILIVFLFFCFFAPQKTEAVWMSTLNVPLQFGVDTIKRIINDGIIGMMKQEAIKEINNQLNNLMGTDGEGAFVTNWRTTLVGEPKNNASLFLNSYLTRSAEGKNTQSGYEGVCGTNYVAAMTETSETRVKESQSVRKFSYDGDPTKMFQGDSFKPMEKYFENNPYSHRLFTEAAYQERLEEEKMIAQTKNIANQGFKDTANAPGIIIKEYQADTNKMSLDAISNGRSAGDFLTAMVNKQILNFYTEKRKEYDSDYEYSDQKTNGVIDVESSYNEYQRQTNEEVT